MLDFLFTTALILATWLVVNRIKRKPKVVTEPLFDFQNLVSRYTPYIDYQQVAALWGGYQTISKEDLNELGFNHIQSELLYKTNDNVCVGGFCLAGGVIQDWPLLQSSERVAPLIGEKYLAVDIIVADDYRRKGLADYMVRKIVRSYGPLRHLMWNAETENTASLKLAKRYGFVEFATTEDTDGGTTIHLIRKAGGR